ncbi:MAG: DEAD/DEAH box helicase [Planctomycetota bacterium]|nr:MAG: DEAD/DEAH box helicase [Planctomycetota bacterium]
MSDQPQLDSLTLRDLRKLAGEHQVPNRSTLNKKELLSALSQTLRGRIQSADSAPKAPPEPSKPPAPNKSKSSAPQPEKEPEVLDPAAVAGLSAVTAPAPSRPQRGKGKDPQRDADSESKGESDGDENSRPGDDGEGTGDGEPRKRRRRRRRRRGKNNDAGDSSEDASDPQADSSNDTKPNKQTGQEPAQDSPAKQGSQPNKHTIRPQSEAPELKRDEKTAAAPSTENKAVESVKGGTPSRPATRGPGKPRLEGPQRSLPSVLDRLQSLSGGLIELCDPDTPSWAQARLGELLAEIGVVATPCQGLPHPKFHEVIGEEAVTGVAPGHISVVDAPGFSLRGDRGDLFPLRKAQVKVTPGSQDEPPHQDAPTTSQREQAVSEQPQSAPSEQSATDQTTPTPDQTDGTSKADAPPEAEAAPRQRSRRGGRKDSNPNPAAETIAEADAEAEIEASRQTEPAPRVRPGLRHKPADEAPLLPLIPIEAEELAARPKAEGFRDLGLNEQILADLHDMGFAQPSPIQAAAIPLSLTGKDLIGQALTGTGKTAAFALPILHRLYEIEGQGPVALILCPTRELARQVHHESTRMAGKSGARTALIYGGVPMDDQVEALSRHPHIVIGTPGRIIDHMKRGNLVTARMQMVILDEADQMLDIGFLPDITYILKHTPASRQTQLFSATMPEEIKRLGTDYMRDPEHIHVMPESVTVDKVDQKYIAVDPDKKTRLLAHFIETKEPEQMVVFCKTKHQTDRVARVLKTKKLSAGAIHGDLPQNKRERTLRDFREGRLTCLIATNVAARGLDIPNVSHVVNYDVPETPEEYVHRIGRTGRMGKEGIARTFLTPEDGQFVVEIEKHIGIELEEEIVDGITATTAAAAPTRSIANAPSGSTPRLLKPIAGGVRLGRRRR